MKIASIFENQNIEKRISITPEIAKKYISLGFEVSLTENYGSHLGIKDEEYKELGVSILKDEKEIITNADIIAQLGLLEDDKSTLLRQNQTLIGILNPYHNKDKISNLVKKNINIFSLELLPRITRAQSMDILSSQANLAGYKAVLESFANFEKAIPMMMTAAGTIPAAKVLVVGAGVAGLQAIATAKRMGAIVFATDVRMASKEQVESLGGKFLTVEGAENLETEGGYAKETSEDFKNKQEELLSETLKKIDIVICTALIPGKKAPIIIKEDMINNMNSSSIIYDLAAIQGGNTAYTKVDEVVDINGVKIMGESNILNKLPTSASNLYAKNVFNFVSNLYDKDNKKININLEDEIIDKTLIK
jgi:NAD(P) transhydrogenase subunit alpha